MNYLALCCIAKDEDPFLKEWLAYHALLGVEHFYVYDHCSRVPIKQTLGPFADDSRVTVRRITGERMQIPAYDDCLASFGGKNRWIGFMDLDEFVLPMRDNDLRALLSEFEAYGGLAATWHMVGPSGHLKRPEGPVIKNYTQAFARQESHQNKCFVRPDRAVQALNPHHFGFKPGFFCVNEDHYPVSPGLQASFSSGRLVRVNHYFLRSQQDFEDKLRRGRADTSDPAKAHEIAMFYNGAAEPWVEDEAILRLLPPLEAALAEGRLPAPAFSPSPSLPYEELMETAMALLEAGRHEKTLVLLAAHEALYAARADFWTLRAMAAQAAGFATRADVFIRQSLMREATETGYAQLRAILRARGEERLAQGIDVLLRRYPDFFS